MGLKSPLSPSKLTTSASVTVRRSESHWSPTSTIASYRSIFVTETHRSQLHLPIAHATHLRRHRPSNQQRHRPPCLRTDPHVHHLRRRQLVHLGSALRVDR